MLALISSKKITEDSLRSEVKHNTEIMPCISCEASVEQVGNRVCIDIPDQDEQVRVLACSLTSDCASLQDKLVGTETSVLEENQLVLVTGIQRLRSIFAD